MVFSFSQVSRGGFPHLFGDKSFHLYVLFISSLDLVYLFPLQAFIFYRLLPFSLDMCLISLSSRNFSNLLNCCLASFFGGKKIYTHCFQSCNVTEAALAGNKWSDSQIQKTGPHDEIPFCNQPFSVEGFPWFPLVSLGFPDIFSWLSFYMSLTGRNFSTCYLNFYISDFRSLSLYPSLGILKSPNLHADTFVSLLETFLQVPDPSNYCLLDACTKISHQKLFSLLNAELVSYFLSPWGEHVLPSKNCGNPVNVHQSLPSFNESWKFSHPLHLPPR